MVIALFKGLHFLQCPSLEHTLQEQAFVRTSSVKLVCMLLELHAGDKGLGVYLEAILVHL